MNEVTQKTENVVVINKAKKSDVFNIDPRVIRVVEGFNTRQNYGDIDELKNSIVENGVRVPMRGYKDGDFYYLTDGHRRFEAINLAISEGIEIARVPFISEKKKSIEERIFDILLFNDGKQLTPLELGETYKRLQNYGYNFTEIAKKIGKTVKHVSDMITVASSSKEIKDIISEGNVSATLVADIKAQIKDDEKAEEIIKDAAIQKKTESPENTKVTKKDVAKSLPKKTTTYTIYEVRGLLSQQIKQCAEGLPHEFSEKVFNTDLVL